MKEDTEDDEDDQDEADEKKRAEQAQITQHQEQREYNYNILPSFSDALRELVTSPQTRISHLEDSIKYFKCIIPKVVSRTPMLVPSKIDT